MSPLPIQLHNTLTRRKEPFEPIEPGRVRMYNCGPTVYGRTHIGNFRSFLFADVLRRWLEYAGYEVRQVMNVTDVGHIQADADQGEDKIEAEARQTRKDPYEISAGYTAMFVEDMEKLGASAPHVRPRATDHIPEMVEIIEGLIERGFAYEVGGNVYFDVTKFSAYGALSGNRVEDLEAGARVEVNEEKRHPADFALWKSDPLHLMKWDTRFGPDGFPGWHIECSAMARKHLGDQIDIHTGGEDNVFPHHECEIAQSEAFTGQPFVRVWMHAKFLQVDGGKMSKSLGNVWTIPDVEERGFEPRVLRFALIRGHYRQPLNFTWPILDECRAALSRLDDLAQSLVQRAGDAEPGAEPPAVQRAREGFEAALADDLNMPEALAALFTLRSEWDSAADPAEAASALAFLRRADGVLGVLRFERAAVDSDLAAWVEERLEARKAARAAKDWAAADSIRDELAARKVTIEDGPDGTTWKVD